MRREPRIGDVVSIVSPKCPAFNNKQGVITKINMAKPHEDGPIRVRFPLIYRDLGRWIGDRGRHLVWFEPTDFEIRPQGFSFEPKEEAAFLWKDMAHTYSWPKFDLLYGGGFCHFKDCSNRAFFEIWYNYLGTATKYHVCAEHAHFHLVAGEDGDFRTPIMECSSESPRKLSIVERAKKVFGENWRIKRPLTFFIPGETFCVHEGCRKHATFQILVNCWGTAYQMDVCPNHVHLHGAKVEQVPYKPAIAKMTFLIEGQIDLNELAHA